jgi:hypothetical protein
MPPDDTGTSRWLNSASVRLIKNGRPGGLAANSGQNVSKNPVVPADAAGNRTHGQK